MNHTFSTSQTYRAAYPDLGFGLTLISGCRDAENPSGFDQYKRKLLRDAKEIVCVLCQGADEKTRVSPATENVLFYAYAVPGIDRPHLKAGLTIAADAMVEFGGGNIEDMTIY